MADLSGLFDPSRVAVVGATDRTGSVGYALMSNLLDSFRGDVVPVNPNRDEVFGIHCVPDLSAAGDVDLAVVAVPPEAALDVVREAGECGIKNVVVVTAGFGETGGDGARREAELTSIADQYDLTLVGPNSLGVMSTSAGMNATFSPTNALSGSLSFMSQSGAFITAVVDWANEQDIGFKDIVSLGNKAVLDETDFVDAWGADQGTDVILGYLESIEDGRAFVERARDVTRDTPIVLVKSGRTDAGAQAASSHTGAIAGSERAYEAGLEKAGVLRAHTIQELFDSARALAGQPLPNTDGVAIVTNAGGPGVMTTDAIGDSTLELASFSEGTIEALTEQLPAEANVYNPVDVIGDADVDRFGTALETVLSDPHVGAVVALACPTAVLSYADLAELIVAQREHHEKPVVSCLMGGTRTDGPAGILREAGIPNYFDPARAIGSLDALASYREIREHQPGDPPSFEVDRERANAVLTQATQRGDSRVGVEAMDLLTAYGIPTPAGEIVDSPDAAVDAAEKLDGPVVLKIVSPDILHKSDIGGVKVGVEPDNVADAYEDLETRARNYQPGATIRGVQVQELVDLEGGTETIVGSIRDPQFGPLVLFGLGGIFVEVLEDTAVRLAPVSRPDAKAMTRELDSAPLLRGTRGRDPVDVDAIVETIGRLSQLVTDFPAILEIDVNPLVATPDGVQAVDIRLTVDPEEL